MVRHFPLLQIPVTPFSFAKYMKFIFRQGNDSKQCKKTRRQETSEQANKKITICY